MKTKKKYNIINYCLYDAGNSNYAALVPSIAFPIYFKSIIASGIPGVDIIWGILISFSTLLAAVMCPKIGAFADQRGSKLVLLRLVSWLAIGGTLGLYFLGKGQIISGAILFIAANTSFLISVALYDATLSSVSSTKNSGLISSIAWAVGYLGGLVGLFLVIFIGGSEEGLLRLMFLVAGGLFFVLSLPLLLMKYKPFANELGVSHKVSGTIAILRNYMKDKTRATLFWSYFMYSNGISAIIYFTSIYSINTLGYSLNNLLWLFVAMSAVAIPSVILFAPIANSLGHIKTLRIIVFCWVIIVIAAAFTNKISFAIIACIAAGFLGPVQALSRSLFRNIFPEESMSSFFGIQALASRSSALIGPLLFGVVSFISGSQRIGVLFNAFLLIIGLILLFKLPSDH